MALQGERVVARYEKEQKPAFIANPAKKQRNKAVEIPFGWLRVYCFMASKS